MSAPEELEAILARYTGGFNAFLSQEVYPRIRQAAPEALSGPILYSLDAPGKRIRPILCLLSAGVAPPEEGGAFQSAPDLPLFAAAAVECIHSYSLIHDDLPAIDNDDLRRGRPSCHKRFSEWQAILAGDALNTYAFELLSCGPDMSKLQPTAAPRIAQLTASLARAAGPGGMAGGQTEDVDFERSQRGGKLEPEEQGRLLQRIHRGKTAALIRAACELGALASGAPAPAEYAAYGEGLGLLFQIADDLLDVQGDERVMGKAAGKDAALGKLTYPGLYGVAESERRARELIEELESRAAKLEPGPDAQADLRESLQAMPAFILNRTS